MSTNPQAPQAPRSGAAAEGQSGPAYDPKAPPTPAGAEGRQSPGLEEALKACRDAIWASLQPHCSVSLEEIRGILAQADAALAAPGAPQGDVQDPRTDREVVDALASVALKLGAEGGELGSEDELEGAKLDILDRLKYFRSSRATPSQEEGPAGVDAEKLIHDLEGAVVSAWVKSGRGELDHGPVIKARNALLARLRAQAPASSPRDLEAVGSLRSMLDACDRARNILRRDGSNWGMLDTSGARKALDRLSAHPPNGETPSEAAGREHSEDPLGMAKLLSDLEAMARETDPAGYMVSARYVLDRLKTCHDRSLMATESRNPLHEAPGTPIEKAAREGLHQIMRDAATITQRLTGDVIVLADRIHDIARASLSSLPQEQTERPKKARECTCVDHCRGGSGLAQGWFCKMAGTRFDPEAPKLAAQEGAAGEGEPLPAEGEK